MDNICSILFSPFVYEHSGVWFLAAEYVLLEWTHLRIMSGVLLSVETSPKHTAPGAL